jgi:hypothetical protein
MARRRKIFLEKYNRSTMENARQLQCKALRRLQKIRRRKNNGKQWKKQRAEQSERTPSGVLRRGHEKAGR